MEYRPRVSIITIVFNGEKYIEQAIQSVLQQTYPLIEYIIIDGGSKDGTLSIIKKYENRIYKWISEKDEGISDAFNKGIKLATGEIVGIINSDDWYEQEAVEKVVKSFPGNDIVFGDLRLWKNSAADFVLKGNREYLEKEMTINHPTVFVKRDCYEKFGLFSKNYKCAMDYELVTRFKANGCTFGYVPGVLANMRWEGISDTKWMIGCKETLAIKNKYYPSRKLSNRLYYYKHILAIAIPKALEKIKLNFLVRMYRSRLAKIKKVYE